MIRMTFIIAVFLFADYAFAADQPNIIYVLTDDSVEKFEILGKAPQISDAKK